MKHLRFLFLLSVLLPMAMAAQEVDYEAGVTVNAGSEELAPYFISALKGGTVTQQYSTLLHGTLRHTMDTTRRLSWGAGAQLWAGWASSTDYYNHEAGAMIGRHPARAWVQELYVEGKYRAVYAVIGQKERGTPWLNGRLSSGDLVMSGNARPGYGVRGGLIDFQNIPLTKGWVQIKGELGYYRFGDGDWLENHYNHRNHFINTGYWMNYKNIYFRTKPDEHLVLTIGLQAACQFGGTVKEYADGVMYNTYNMDANAKAFFKALIPGSGGSGAADANYYEGNHLGSWDVALQYNLKNGASLRAYHQHLWEDGSGIGFKNGFDGLWGLEYNAGRRSPLSGVVVEYLDLTNQSGPLHFNPHDYTNSDRPAGSPVTGEATGSDDYYNNYGYNGYHNRGLSIGSPMVLSPLYHTDGYMRYYDNRMRGVHIAFEGTVADGLSYRARYAWRKSWGNIFMPRPEAATMSSWSLEGQYDVKSVDGLRLNLQLALDRGDLASGNPRYPETKTNFGVLLGVAYHGNFSLRK